MADKRDIDIEASVVLFDIGERRGPDRKDIDGRVTVTFGHARQICAVLDRDAVTTSKEHGHVSTCACTGGDAQRRVVLAMKTTRCPADTDNGAWTMQHSDPASVMPVEMVRSMLLRVAGQWGPLAEARVRFHPRVDDDFLIEGADIEVRGRPEQPWQHLASVDDAGIARSEVHRFAEHQQRRRRFADEVTVPAMSLSTASSK